MLRHSNAGGAYRFRAEDGEPVFVKEAKAHNGYTADGADAKTRLNAEYLALRAIHGREPGLCPRPVELFHHWEHSYLVTEFIARHAAVPVDGHEQPRDTRRAGRRGVRRVPPPLPGPTRPARARS